MLKKLTILLAKFLTDKAIVSMILGLGERLAKRTATTVDDDIIAALRDFVDGKSEKSDKAKKAKAKKADAPKE